MAGVVVSVGAAGVQWADGGITWLGLGLALGALACEAAFSLLAAPHLERLGALAVSAYACLFALPLLAGWGIVAGGPELPAPSAEELAALVYLGAIVTTGGFLCWYTAVGILGVERAGLFAGVLPVSALACSAALGVAGVTPERSPPWPSWQWGSRLGYAASAALGRPPRTAEAPLSCARPRAVPVFLPLT